MTTWQIKDWSTKFSLSEFEKKIKHWNRVPIPISLAGERYRMLMATSKGREMFAVFIGLVEVAANLPIRGVLADERGPLSSRSLSVKTGVPEKVIAATIAYLSDPDIGWLVEWSPSGRRPVDEPDDDRTASGRQPVPASEKPLNSQASEKPSPKPPPRNGTPTPPPKPREGGGDFEHEPDPEPGTKRLTWQHVSAIYAAYPPPHRGSKGEFTRAVAEAWAALEASGSSDPGLGLLTITKTYAASWTGKRDGGRFTVNPRRFFAHDGVWTQDPRDWAEPKTGEPSPQSERQRTAWAKVGELRQALNLLGGREKFHHETEEKFAQRTAEFARLDRAIVEAVQRARECTP